MIRMKNLQDHVIIGILTGIGSIIALKLFSDFQNSKQEGVI